MLNKVKAEKVPALHPIPSRDREDLKSSHMFNNNGNSPGLKFRSQTNQLLFSLFFLRCLLVVTAEDKWLGQADPQSEPARPS